MKQAASLNASGQARTEPGEKIVCHPQLFIVSPVQTANFPPVNDPLQPNDPLWNLLGKARQPEPRGNFSQNVMRAARHTPQTRGWLAAVMDWLRESPSALPRLAVAAAAVLAIAGIAVMQVRDAASSSEQTVAAARTTEPLLTAAVPVPPLVADVESQWENTQHIDALLAMEDASAFTDSEIAFLLY